MVRVVARSTWSPTDPTVRIAIEYLDSGSSPAVAVAAPSCRRSRVRSSPAPVGWTISTTDQVWAARLPTGLADHRTLNSAGTGSGEPGFAGAISMASAQPRSEASCAFAAVQSALT